MFMRHIFSDYKMMSDMLFCSKTIIKNWAVYTDKNQISCIVL